MINRFTLEEDLKNGELCLRANKRNQTTKNINEVVQFLTDHPEVATLHFFNSFITRELAERLAVIPTIKKINFFSHACVAWDFYNYNKTHNPALIDSFQKKTGREEISITQKQNFFAQSRQRITEDLETSENLLPLENFNKAKEYIDKNDYSMAVKHVELCISANTTDSNLNEQARNLLNAAKKLEDLSKERNTLQYKNNIVNSLIETIKRSVNEVALLETRAKLT